MYFLRPKWNIQLLLTNWRLLNEEAGFQQPSGCNNCGAYNLLDVGEGVKYYRPGNYTHIEHLSKDDFTREKALARLEQTRYFGKK
jgi:hypothetical protein